MSLNLSLSFINPSLKERPLSPVQKRNTLIYPPSLTSQLVPFVLFCIFHLISFQRWLILKGGVMCFGSKVSHAVRMGKQLSKCERNPWDYSHTQNVTTMQNNPGAERLSECSLIEDTMLCEQGHASSLLKNKKLKWGLTRLLLKGGNKPQPA